MSGSAQSSSETGRGALDEALAVLADHATRFARMAPADKARLLRECIPRLRDVAGEWVATGARAKGLATTETGEEWLAGPIPAVRMARLLAGSLDHIASKGRPPLGTGSSVTGDGRLTVDVFPTSAQERVLFAGFTATVHIEDGLDRTEARARQASFYQQRDPDGGVSLVLGAGNVSSIPPMDVFTKMFEEGFVCLLKMNPVNEWAGPILERGLAPLISRGFLRIVYGGGDVGAYLVSHEAVADVHITGSNKTHDVIVWGPPGEERDRRMKAGEPVLDKPISSELGNVSPVAIVPYTYTDDELWFQARNVASMVVNNASFNCNAAKLLVTSEHWEQREAFLGLVARALGEVPTRLAYYPGAFDRYRALTEGRDVETIGEATDEKLAWTLIRNVDASDADDPIFSTEPFCGILAETCVGTADPVEFLATAGDFLDERVWGTLNAMIVVPPALERDPTVGKVLARTVDRLRYGTVAINHWPALGYALASPPWGGHPSSTLDNIHSGRGWVHNTFMLGGIDKCVIRGNLRVKPNPLWFYDSAAKAASVGPKLLAQEAEPSWLKVPGIALRAIFG